MSKITTHILDTSRGKPASNVEVTLERAAPNNQWQRLSAARTDSNGRIADFPGAGELLAGTHRLVFNIAAYNAKSFFPRIDITFEVTNPTEHHHVPLLLSPFGYSTYRGS